MISRFLGFIILVSSLAVIYLFESQSSLGGMFLIFHWPAMVLTFIGPIGLILLSSPASLIGDFFQTLRGPSPKKILDLAEDQARVFHKISENYYSKGTAIFNQFSELNLNPIIGKMIERLSLKIPPQDVRNLLIRDRMILETKLEQVSGVASLGVRLAPSIGMLGTILGMTQLLSHLKDPSSLGSHMSLALLTTFYGLFCSLVIWTPIEHYLNHILQAHIKCLDQAEHWIELLEQRKPAQYFSGEVQGHVSEQIIQK